MSQAGFNPGLRLKIARQGRAAADAPRPDGFDRALDRALGKAGAPYDGLALEAVAEAPQWDIHPPEIAKALPDAGLLTLLDAGDDARALCLMDPGLVDALIEVQTTGRVDPGQGAARAPTRIDAALTRDFLGLFLAALASELSGKAGVNWPLGLSYGTLLQDRRQLNLLLPDGPYHLFSATLDLGRGAKTGRLLLAVPVTGHAAPAQRGASKIPNDWQDIVRAAPLSLEAVLLRQTLPLSRIEALKPGDVLSFDREDLSCVELCDARGAALFRGRLGRASGRRALRLLSGRGLGPPPAACAPATVPRQDNQAPDPSAMESSA